MKAVKNTMFALMMLVGSLFFMSANQVSEATNSEVQLTVQQPITSIVALETVKANITELEAKTDLSKKETRQLKRFKKRVARIEKAEAGGKSWIAALLLAWFLGILGIHRFYLGYTWQGVVQLLTFGGLGIWALIDFIRIIIRDLLPNGGSYTD